MSTKDLEVISGDLRGRRISERVHGIDVSTHQLNADLLNFGLSGRIGQWPAFRTISSEDGATEPAVSKGSREIARIVVEDRKTDGAQGIATCRPRTPKSTSISTA